MADQESAWDKVGNWVKTVQEFSERLARTETRVDEIMKRFEASERDAKELKDSLPLDTFCEHCVVKRVVYWVIALIGAAFVGLMVTMVLKGK